MNFLFILLASFTLLIPHIGFSEVSAPAEVDVVSSYEEAKRLEAEIVEMYREMRAAELSMVQRQTMDRSLESTLIPLSDRAEINAELLRKTATNADAIEEYQQELGVVIQETDAIVSNARSLLDQFIEEPSSTTQEPRETSEASEEQEEQEETREETQEEKAAREQREEQEEREKSSSSKQEREAREKARQEQEEKLEQEIEEELAKTEEHLKEALKEIREAREDVAEEKEEVETSMAEKEKKQEEIKEEKEQMAKLEELEKQVDAAEQAVEDVVKEVEALKEVSEEQKEKAEEAVEKLREALASVLKADASASESDQKEAKEHTSEAANQMKKAGESLGSAKEKMSELETLSEGDGDGGGGGNSDGEGEGENISEALAIERQQALGKLAKASSGRWLDLTDQMRGQRLDAKPVPPPAAELPELWGSQEELENAPSARKILASSYKGDQWIFVGDWYTLSRYDNTGRENIQKVYPPESILDLNAHYLSEDGKRLQWEYESYAPPVVTPYGWEEWKIYYYTTELFFEEEMEVWIAIGSDDRSDLWINDLPVWHSANQHKGWYPGEGFRKVVFKKGHNKVLLRLENGHGGANFSLYLNLSRR